MCIDSRLFYLLWHSRSAVSWEHEVRRGSVSAIIFDLYHTKERGLRSSLKAPDTKLSKLGLSSSAFLVDEKQLNPSTWTRGGHIVRGAIAEMFHVCLATAQEAPRMHCDTRCAMYKSCQCHAAPCDYQLSRREPVSGDHFARQCFDKLSHNVRVST